jgi:hypothetical protein
MKSLLIATTLLAACGDETTSGLDPETAPVASVDRFSDSFGTLFKRSAPVFDPANVQPNVPAPNAAIDFDALFTVRALGPVGQPVTYYSFDILPRAPGRGFVILRDGAEIAGQLRIIEKLPGDEGYNDFVRITEVRVGSGYVANTLASVDDIDDAIASGAVTAVETARIANWVSVPAGSTAVKKFNGQVVTGQRAWKDGEVVHQMRFEENLTVTDTGTVPTAEIIVMFDNNMDPSAGFAHELDGSTRNAIDTRASDPGYSSLWNHSVGNKANFTQVTDFATAFDNVMAANVGVDVNCPEVE